VTASQLILLACACRAKDSILRAALRRRERAIAALAWGRS
jgi:hypothetical protein